MILLQTVLLANLIAPSPLAPTLPPFQQEEASSQGDELVIEYFHPTTAPVDELEDALTRLYRMGAMPPSNTLVFGDSILVQSTSRDAVKQVLGIMRRLDEEWVGARRTREPLETLEYRARYVPLISLRDALQPFSHPLMVTGASGMTSQVPNVSFLDQRGMILVRGPRSELDEIQGLLQRVDQPQPQIRVTCYLLEGSVEGKADPRVPAELVKDLAAIVPYEGFELLSFGLFQSDALANIQLQESLPEGGEFGLELYPKTFEPSTRSITFDRCRFELSRPTPGSNRHQTFTTSARVSLDDYVVLGAIGSDPVFVVLRLTLIEG